MPLSPGRSLPLLLWLTALGCGPTKAVPPGAQGSAAPPNILLISIDTLRADHLSCYGYGRETTPNLDALAARGVLFERAYSSSSWTLPGLASLVTGEHSSTHGCWTFGSRLGHAHTTLAEYLLARGYDTASLTTNLFTSNAYGLQQGIVLADDGSFRGAEGPMELSVTSPRVSDDAIAYLEAKAAVDDGWPWFLWLHYLDPHDTYVEHEGFSERFITPGETDPVRIERDLYDGEILFTDHHIGRVLDSLAALGLERETIVVLVADHGEEFGDHGQQHHGHSLYTELTHMPLIVSGPGIDPARVTTPASIVDVLPTLLELAGVDAEREFGGRSLVPTLRGEQQPEVPILTEVRLHPHSSFEALRLWPWFLIRNLDAPGRLTLFETGSDPGEQVDLAGREPDRVEDLELLLRGSVRQAAERGQAFGGGAEIQLSTDQLETIRGLGYIGEDR